MAAKIRLGIIGANVKSHWASRSHFPALLVSEAGGRWSDLGGRPLYDSGSLLTSNGVLHDRLVGDLREPAVVCEGAS